MSENNKELEQHYFSIVDLWKSLCEEHNELFNLTCDEYATLLSGKIENLDDIVGEKEKTISKISVLERKRQGLIEAINTNSPETPVQNVSELLILMQQFEKGTDSNHLFRFNRLLIDIIEKIQDQNKRNKLFVNKALHNLKKIREETLGQKSYTTYTSKGSAESMRAR